MNLVQLAGTLAYLLAAMTCLWAATPTAPGWRGLAGLYGLMVLDLQLNLRFRVHDLAVALLQAQGIYQQRSGLQLSLMAGAAGLLVVTVLIALRANRRPHPPSPQASTASPTVLPWLVGLLGGSMALGITALETISLHATDAWLYTPAGPMPRVAWGWLLAAGLGSLGAVAARLCRPCRV